MLGIAGAVAQLLARRRTAESTALFSMSDLTIVRATVASFQDPRDGWAFVGSQKAVNEPRIFDDGAILIEGERTNLVPNSANFDDPPWDHLNSPTVATNSATAPDGTNTANLLVFASGGSDGQVRELLADTDFTDGEKSVWSVWLQGDGADELRLYFRDKASANELLEVYAPAAAFERVTRIVDNGSGTTDPLIGLLEETDGAPFLAWGFQVEADKEYPSTYIPTSGGSDTCNADLATMTVDAALAAAIESPYGVTFSVWPEFSDSDARLANMRLFDIGGGVLSVYYHSTADQVKAAGDGGLSLSTTVTSGWDALDELKVTVRVPSGGPTGSLTNENDTQPTGPYVDTDTYTGLSTEGETLTLGNYNGGTSYPGDSIFGLWYLVEYTPAIHYDLSVWLRGDDGFTGASWRNDGSADDFDQGTAGQQPSSGTINGLGCAEFDATNDNQVSGALSTVVTASEWWVSFVFRPDAITWVHSPTQPWKDHSVVADGGGFWGVFCSTSGVHAYQWDGSQKHTAGAGALSPGTAYYVEAWYDGTDLHCRVDDGTDQTTTAGNITLLSNDVSVGKSSLGDAFDHGLGELVICKSVPIGHDLQEHRAYMEGRWGVTVPDGALFESQMPSNPIDASSLGASVDIDPVPAALLNPDTDQWWIKIVPNFDSTEASDHYILHFDTYDYLKWDEYFGSKYFKMVTGAGATATVSAAFSASDEIILFADRGTLKMYVNGVLEDTDPIGDNWTAYTTCAFGGTSGDNHLFDGDLYSPVLGSPPV